MLNHDARASAHELNADDKIIACALLDSGALLKTRQFIGYEPLVTIRLKCPALKAEDVECCHVFVRSRTRRRLRIWCGWK